LRGMNDTPYLPETWTPIAYCVAGHIGEWQFDHGWNQRIVDRLRDRRRVMLTVQQKLTSGDYLLLAMRRG